MWEEPDRAGNIEPLNSDESSLPVRSILSTLSGSSISIYNGEAFLLPSEMIKTALPKEMVMVSSEATATQENTGSLQYLLPPPLFASGPIIILKSHPYT